MSRLALEKEGSNVSAIGRLSKEDKLLYIMIFQIKETPGDEEDKTQRLPTPRQGFRVP